MNRTDQAPRAPSARVTLEMKKRRKVAEQVEEGVTRVVVRGDRPSEEKLDDAKWWGIPVVDAADFLAMLRGDGVAAAPSSSRRAPKRRRRK